MRTDRLLPIALGAICIACGGSSTTGERDLEENSASESESGTGAAASAGHDRSSNQGNDTSAGGTAGTGGGGEGAMPGVAGGGSGGIPRPDGGGDDGGSGGATSGSASGSDDAGGEGASSGIPFPGDSGLFAVSVEICDPVTAIPRFIIRKQSRFGSSCTEVVVAQGLTGDAGADLSIPDGWGIEDVAFYDDSDCTVTGDYDLISVSGTLAWESPSSAIPTTVDIDLTISRLGNIGRPASESILGTDVPVQICQ